GARAAASARPSDYRKPAGRDFSGPAGTGWLRRQLVFVGRLELVFGRYELAPEALEPVLAPNARRDFRQRLEPRGRDRFFAFDTDPIVAALQPLERRREPVDPAHQKPARGESDLATLVLLDLVDLVGVRRVVADRSSYLLDRNRPADHAEPADSR